MSTQIAQLFATLGFNVKDKGVKEFKEKINDTKKSLISLQSIVKLAIATALYNFTKDTMDTVASLEMFNKTTGTSIELLQDWQAVAERNNVSKQAIIGVFETISKAKADFLQGKPNNAWYMLGIDPTGNPEKIFNNVLKNLEKIKDTSLRTKRLTDLGFSKEIIALIGKTRKDYVDYVVQVGFLDDKQRKEVLDLKQKFNGLWFALKQLKDLFVFLASPVKYFIELTSRIIHIIGNLTREISNNKDAFDGLKLAIITIMAIINPVIAGITALILVFEDLFVFDKGGQSIIGKLIEEIPLLEKPVRVLIALFKGLWEAIKGVLEGFKYLFEYIGKILSISFGGFKSLFKGAKNIGEDIGRSMFEKGKGTDYLINQEKQETYLKNLKYINEHTAKNPLRQLANNTGQVIYDNYGNIIQPTKELSKMGLGSNSNINDNRKVEININGGNIEEVKNTITKIVSDNGYNDTFITNNNIE